MQADHMKTITTTIALALADGEALGRLGGAMTLAEAGRMRAQALDAHVDALASLVQALDRAAQGVDLSTQRLIADLKQNAAEAANRAQSVERSLRERVQNLDRKDADRFALMEDAVAWFKTTGRKGKPAWFTAMEEVVGEIPF